LWSCGGQGFTRGLAASERLIFVGNSQVASRGQRDFSESGIWVLDRQSFALCNYLFLGSFGDVHEVRIADEPDACHRQSPLRKAALSNFEHWRVERQRNVLMAATTGLPDRASWQSRFGWIVSRDGVFVASSDGIALMTHRSDASTRDSRICAKLHVLSWHTAHHAALVTRYAGPGDQRMYAAIFQLDESHRLVASIWLHDGEWRCLASKPLDSTVTWHDEGARRELMVCLETRGSELIVRAAGKAVLQVQDAALSDGLNGVRILGDTIGLSDFEVVT